MHGRERLTGAHLVHRDDSGRQLTQAARRQPAGEILGEHGQPFLRLVVAGQSSAEQPQRLTRAVDVGDDVRTDLVLEQRMKAVRWDDGGRRDEQVAVGHHHAAAVVAHLDMGGQIGEHGRGTGRARPRRGERRWRRRRDPRIRARGGGT